MGAESGFTALPSKRGSLKISRRQLRRLIKPAGDYRSGTKTSGFPCQNNENDLGNLLGFVGVVQLAKRRGVDQIDVPRNQYGECPFGTAPRKFLDQFCVIGLHSWDNVRTPLRSRQNFCP